MLIQELRRNFIDFFVNKQHTEIVSSALVPNNDPTLLFTNAGMVQFKDMFLDPTISKYKRATSCQRCMRAGGKHNDLDNVGFTARHHTLFEMLGNFSFGDYFKEEAISFAWEFVTKVLCLPKERLWITVYKDDDVAHDLWVKIGVPRERIARCDQDNFWAMGDTGPCGPCTEIFYDHGKELPGDPPGGIDSGDRFIEIWNLVFMQYNRDSDGIMQPLPKPCVDTGAGLERLAAVMQGVHNNYDIDLFAELIQGISNTLQISLKNKHVLHVLADHIRAASFLMADQIFPSNEGRGYVLRRIMRRAIRYGHSVGQREPFFYKLVPILVPLMATAYPQLKHKEQEIQLSCKREEEQFFYTLEQGIKLFKNHLQNHTSNIISGDFAFKLYDTYGFPVDLTQIMAQECNKTVAMQEFNQAMEVQRQQSRQASNFSANITVGSEFVTNFIGYETLVSNSIIQAIYINNQSVELLPPNTEAMLVLDVTPFYANSGGQVGDIGKIFVKDTVFQVTDTRKANKAHVHYGILTQGNLRVGESVSAEVDGSRQDIKANHTATHLLHAALQQILGAHVEQKGSVVDKDRLRFDFTHQQALTAEELILVEDLVNYQIRTSKPTTLEIMSMEDALKKGAMALFSEKYGDNVRVLTLNDGFSIELCGGTHVNNVGELGVFKILSEQSIAQNVRRIEAITGRVALKWIQEQTTIMDALRKIFKVEASNIVPRVIQLNDKIKVIETELARCKQKLFNIDAQELRGKIIAHSAHNSLVAQIDAATQNEIRTFIEQLKSQYDPIIVILIVRVEPCLYVGISRSVQHISAVELLKQVAPMAKGGGKIDFAQAKITNTDILTVLSHAENFCQQL